MAKSFAIALSKRFKRELQNQISWLFERMSAPLMQLRRGSVSPYGGWLDFRNWGEPGAYKARENCQCRAQDSSLPIV